MSEPGVTLNEAELFRVTGYVRPGDQLAALHRLGYYRAWLSKTTGKVILERPHYDAVAAGGGQAINDSHRRPTLRAIK